MRYHELERAIGLTSEAEEWHVSYRKPVTDILNLVAATQRQSGKSSEDDLQFERLVNAKHEPVGVHRPAES